MKYILKAVLIVLPLLLMVGVALPQDGSSIDSRVRPLDFSPFEDELQTFESERMVALHEIAFEATIADIQQAFENGDMTAVELTLYYLSRIRQYDVEHLHAVLELNPEALDIARMLDEERASGNVRGPMHGIPVLLKDIIGTGDMLHTTAGAVAMLDARSDRDAFIVIKLREAGAIILGKANLAEWANFISPRLPAGYSTLGGQVVNPYGESLDPSSSSTGSAVSVSSNLTTVAVGVSTWGAIIGPSAKNSVVGMYPSLGLISRDRIIPLSEFMDNPGPIARNVYDLAVLLTALAGTDPADSYTMEAAKLEGTDFTTFLDVNALQGKRVVVVFNSGMSTETYVRAFLTQQVADSLTGAGAEIVFAPIPDDPGDIYLLLIYGMQTGVDRYLTETNAPFATLADIVAFNSTDPDMYIPYGQGILEDVIENTYTFEDAEKQATSNRTIARERLQALMTENDADVIVSIDYQMVGLYPSAGFPAITVPGGYRDDGQPFGVTFVGDYLTDGELIGYAYAFEKASHFRVPPPIGEE